MKYDNEYFRRWYQKHKHRLAVKRNRRYREDPVYRAKALLQAKTQREKAKEKGADNT